MRATPHPKRHADRCRARRTRRLGAAGLLLATVVIASAPPSVDASPLAAAPAVTAAAASVAPGSWRPAAGTVPDVANVLYLESAPGEWVGGGRTFTYTPANSAYDVAVRGGILTANIGGDDRWQTGFSLPPGTGSYEAGQVFENVAASSWEHAGVTVSRSPHGCNSFVQRGWFAVDEATTEGGVLASATVRFEQRCDGPTSPPLRGLLRYDADASLPPPETPSSPVPTLWSPAAGTVPTSGNALYLASEPGDAVGQGGSSLFTGAEVEVSASGNELRSMAIASAGVDAGSGQLWLQGATRSTGLDAGLYSRLLHSTDANRGRGLFQAQRNLTDCSGLASTSWVVIDEADQRGGTWNDVTLRFEQRCRSERPAMRGWLHWEAPAPAGAPGPPTAAAASASGTSATLTWSAPTASGNGPITGYQVFTYIDGTVRSAPTVVGPTARSLTLTGLASGRTHSFKVRAVNAAGAGLRSARTLQPSTAPTAPSVASLSPSTGPRTRGTAFRVKGAALAGATSVTVGGKPTEWWPVSDTEIEVIAPALSVGPHPVVVTSSAGASSATPGAVWTALPLPPTAPGLVTVAARAAGADVSWWTPASDAPLLGYTVTATKAGASAPHRITTVGPDATTAGLDALTPGSTYTVSVVARSSAGSSPAATSAPVTVPLPDLGPFATATALAEQQYRDFVGRRPTSAEATAAANRITTGADRPEDTVAAMRNRAEWGGRRAAVIRLYLAYFGRLPDASGLTYWAGRREAGTQLARVSAAFAASAEFQRKQGRLGDPAFVRFVFDAVLDRAPDPSGLAYWTRKLAAGTSRGTVMTGFSESSEHVRKTLPTVDVVLAYTGMLRRIPTTGELASERPAIEGGAPVSDLARRLLDSDEYATRIAG